MTDTDWAFSRLPGVPLDDRDAVFQALGGASMCWNPKPSSQVFDPERAAQIGELLCAELGIRDPDQPRTGDSELERCALALVGAAQLNDKAALHALLGQLPFRDDRDRLIICLTFLSATLLMQLAAHTSSSPTALLRQLSINLDGV